MSSCVTPCQIGSNDLVAPAHLAFGKPIKFILRPFFLEKRLTQNNNTESRLLQTFVQGPPNTVTQLERELVIPNFDMFLLERIRQRTHKGFLIFRGVTNEQIVKHFIYRLNATSVNIVSC